MTRTQCTIRRLLPIFLVLSILSLSAHQAIAHSPSGMTLEYDFDSQMLTVSVTHSVSDVNTHHVEQIVVSKNGAEVVSRDYTTQDTTSGMTDTFSIEAADGDVISVTAICNQVGSITRELTVTASDETTTTPEDTETPDTTNGIEMPLTLTVIMSAAILILVIGLIVMCLRRRY